MDRRCYHQTFDKKTGLIKACRCYRLKHSRYPLCSTHSRRIFNYSYTTVKLSINRIGIYLTTDLWQIIDSFLLPNLLKPCPYVYVTSKKNIMRCYPCNSLCCMGNCANRTSKIKYLYSYLDTRTNTRFYSADFWTIVEDPDFPDQNKYKLYHEYYLKYKEWFDNNRKYIKS